MGQIGALLKKGWIEYVTVLLSSVDIDRCSFVNKAFWFPMGPNGIRCSKWVVWNSPFKWNKMQQVGGVKMLTKRKKHYKMIRVGKKHYRATLLSNEPRDGGDEESHDDNGGHLDISILPLLYVYITISSPPCNYSLYRYDPLYMSIYGRQ